MIKSDLNLTVPLRLPAPQHDPLPPRLNSALYGALVTLETLYLQNGKNNFAILTHRDPDADAIAAMLGIRRIVSELSGNKASVSLYYDRSSSSEKTNNIDKKLQSSPTIALARDLRIDSLRERTAIILVDQPSLHSGTVLSPALAKSPFLPLEADLILDHHGASRYDSEAVIDPRAGSTAALVLRMLQLATQSNFISEKWCHDSKLLSHIVCGAEMDAGIPLNTQAQTIDWAKYPLVNWVRKCALCSTQHEAATERLRGFYDVSQFSEELRDHARQHRRSIGSFALDETIFRCEVAYAGFAADKAHLADCATNLIRELKAASAENQILIVLGVLRNGNSAGQPSPRAGDTVQICVRGSNNDLPVRSVAKLLSRFGGGGSWMGAASVQVPQDLDNNPSPAAFLHQACEMVWQRLLRQGSAWKPTDSNVN